MMQYQQIKPDRSFYKSAAKTFTQTLEELDPTALYKDDNLLSGTDAFQRQLKRFDIRVSGPDSDVVDKFFQTADSAALFPEYVARAIRTGMEESNILPAILATTTHISGMDYRAIAAVNDGLEAADVMEGAKIPETVISTKESLIRLTKRGRMVVSSYEAIRFQKLDIFTVALKQVGASIMAGHIADAVNVLINGDGNNNAAPTVSVATQGTLTYNDLIGLWGQFDPYEMNTLLVSNVDMQKLLKLDEFKNPETGLNFQGTGKLTGPLGARLIRCSAVPQGKIVALDRRYALEMVKAGDVSMDTDRLIDRQLERAAVTSIAGFAKIIPEAVCVLTV